MVDMAVLCERGWIPDPLARFGMRRLIRERLDEVTAGGREVSEQRLNSFIESLKTGPIAVATSDANEQHYEVPSELFERVLGPRLKYSCCWYESERSTLAQAEEAMLALSCERAGIEDGMKVLDLGCGWGSLALWVAEKYPAASVTAVSNSATQRAHIEARAEAAGIGNLTVITANIVDWDTTDRFDRICSIEMFEHMSNWEALLSKVSGWLEADGRLFTHVFCNRDYGYHYENGDGWMERWFFTGGIMPVEDQFTRFPDQVEVQQRWWVNGQHYERTCNHWLAECDAQTELVTRICRDAYGDADAEVWVQRWRMFFMACAELFGLEGGERYGVVHTLMKKAGG